MRSGTPQRLEVGDGREFVPLYRLLAEVKVFQPQRDSAQEEVLSKRLGAENTELKLTQAQSLFAVAAVDELRRRRRRRRNVSLHSKIPEHEEAGLVSFPDHLIKGGVPRSS